MAGVKGRSGGRRPNTGPKPKPVKDWQLRNLGIFQSEFSEDDIRKAARGLRDALKGADKDAWKYLPYLIGPTPKEVTVQGDDDAPLKMVVEVAYTDTQSNTD